MPLFKCKMCGGDLEIAEGLTIAECEYCGTKQAVPKVMDENLQSSFNRANTLRIKSEFDKAEKLYEKIIQTDPTQADAYWGLILCKYGIEYVDDPATLRKIPTCHRASYDSVIADDDYKSALEHADMSQRAIYEEQAKEIDRIQKEILALAQKEETYDVFICYKETDANGQRTQDSVIANDIYYQLTNEGFKVFYAAITLEGKLGSAYEPIIFAALNSAKVMLTIGTKPEYFNAVWVKNEWSRFLKIIKNDRSKLLIPCYRDMDAYELPEEFAHLQAQDMSKIGFINDVVRGIKKVITKDEPKTVVKETVVTNTNTNVAPLLKRAFMFLEDGEWEKADDFCEQVLNQDPECAEAYLGKLMADLRVKTKDALKDQAEPFDRNNNYIKVLRFGNDKLKNELVSVISYINERNENARLDGIYNQAMSLMSTANSETKYYEAAEVFRIIAGYKDADQMAELCVEKGKECAYINAKQAMDIACSDEEFLKAAWLFEAIQGYKDADEQAAICFEKANELTYNTALQILNNANSVANFIKARERFWTISGYKDADDLAVLCEEKRKECIYNCAIEEMNTASSVSDFENIRANLLGISGYKDADDLAEMCIEKGHELRYTSACETFITATSEERYNQAREQFLAISDYKDAKAKANKCLEAIEAIRVKNKQRTLNSKKAQIAKDIRTTEFNIASDEDYIKRIERSLIIYRVLFWIYIFTFSPFIFSFFGLAMSGHEILPFGVTMLLFVFGTIPYIIYSFVLKNDYGIVRSSPIKPQMQELILKTSSQITKNRQKLNGLLAEEKKLNS